MQGVAMFEKLILEEYLEWDKTHKRAISHELEEAILKAIANREALPEEWKGRRDGVGLGNAIYFERSRCTACNPISRKEVVTITSIYYDFHYKVWEWTHAAWPFRPGEKLPFKVFSLRRQPETNQLPVRRERLWAGFRRVPPAVKEESV